MGRNDNSHERSPWTTAVADTIRAETAAKRWSIDEASRETGIPRSTFVRLRDGKREATTTQLARIAGALGIPLSELFRRVESRHPEEGGGSRPA